MRTDFFILISVLVASCTAFLITFILRPKVVLYAYDTGKAVLTREQAESVVKQFNGILAKTQDIQAKADAGYFLTYALMTSDGTPCIIAPDTNGKATMTCIAGQKTANGMYFTSASDKATKLSKCTLTNTAYPCVRPFTPSPEK